MKITTVLFDLDGTLLPMDQGCFVKAYFGGVAKKMAPHGYEAKQLIDVIWAGTAAMVKNDGAETNEAVFWKVFAGAYGADRARRDYRLFEEFYRDCFDDVAKSCGYTPLARQTVDLLKQNGIRRVLATNPIFPSIATEKRMAWAGLSPNDFEYFTTYENARHCKPNPDYYRDILNVIGNYPEECLMVGNDVGEDMIAEKLGMQVFLLTDCLINPHAKDTSVYPNGGFSELLQFLQANVLHH